MIREVTDIDRAEIREWGKHYGSDYPWLPAFGLRDNHAAIFLLTTECPYVAFIEVAIGNPASSRRDVYVSLRSVSSALVAHARKQGYTRIIALSSIRGVIAAAQHSGAIKVKDEVLQWELNNEFC